MPEGAGYRFEPLERRGVLLGLGAGQLAVLGVSVLAALLCVKALPGGAGFAVAAGALAVGGLVCRPVGGRALPQWLSVAVLFGARHRARAVTPPVLVPGQVLALPARTFAPGVYLCELPAASGHGAIGALIDERSGTAAALLRARGGSFCLLDDIEKERQVAAWAAVLDAVSGHRGSLARLQWCQRTLPADGKPLLDHLQRAGDASSPGYEGHVSLLERAGLRSWRHETLMVVSVRCRGRLGHGRPSREGVETLRNEVGAVRAQMRSSGLVCDGVLDAPGAALALGSFFDPGTDRHPGAYPWPLALEEHWGELRADSSWHRTYWVAEWPRSRVGPDFLSPLLVGAGRRSFSVVMAPVPADRAQRDAENTRTAHVADAQLRAQGGFLETARHRRESEAVEGREAQLADGRGVFELAGYVTVSAGDKQQLDEACSELEGAAGAAMLTLRRLYGQQREALTWALPFGRGL